MSKEKKTTPVSSSSSSPYLKSLALLLSLLRLAALGPPVHLSAGLAPAHLLSMPPTKTFAAAMMMMMI